jgi:hypothetical protein
MTELINMLEDALERLCVWVNDFFPGDRRLALVGHTLAGLRTTIPLPIDRRLGPPVMLMAHNNGGEMATVAKAKGGLAHPEDDCGFWAYCHMNGQPCIWCSGKNAILTQSADQEVSGRASCPSGKIVGSAWYGCCKDPSGKIKMIGFLDCCGPGVCSYLKGRCRNWPDAKNWCFFDGQSSRTGARGYYCTAAIWIGECS